MKMSSEIKLKGIVEVLTYKKGNLIAYEKNENIILDEGFANELRSIWSNNHLICKRVAVGDRGTIPSDPTIPKVPTPDRTTLYNEVFRKDVDSIDEYVSTKTVRFTVSIDSSEIPITAFSNQSKPVLNEVMLIMADALSGAPFPRDPVVSPATPPADEKGYAMRCFKSVPFEQANEISVTIRYSIVKE